MPFRRSVAFLVGVGNYPYLPNLEFVDNDLEDMRRYLLSLGGFDEVYVARGRVATRDVVESYMINHFREQLGPDDRLLFYFAGHGADLGTTGYFQLYEARPDDFARGVLPVESVHRWSNANPVGHLLFILDSCASGLAVQARSVTMDFKQQLQWTLSGNGSRTLITAGTGNQETYEWNGNGILTGALLSALERVRREQPVPIFMTIGQIFEEALIPVGQFSILKRQPLRPRIWPLETQKYNGSFVFLNPAYGLKPQEEHLLGLEVVRQSSPSSRALSLPELARARMLPLEETSTYEVGAHPIQMVILQDPQEAAKITVTLGDRALGIDAETGQVDLSREKELAGRNLAIDVHPAHDRARAVDLKIFIRGGERDVFLSRLLRWKPRDGGRVGELALKPGTGARFAVRFLMATRPVLSEFSELEATTRGVRDNTLVVATKLARPTIRENPVSLADPIIELDRNLEKLLELIGDSDDLSSIEFTPSGSEVVASQGRLLFLIAGKSRIEQQAQLVNQARISLANIIGGLFNFSATLDPNEPQMRSLQTRIQQIQSTDKILELRLRRLDTKRDAYQTEIDAVRRVVGRKTVDSFKTFG